MIDCRSVFEWTLAYKTHKLRFSWLRVWQLKELSTLDEGDLFVGERLLVVHMINLCYMYWRCIYLILILLLYIFH